MLSRRLFRTPLTWIAITVVAAGSAFGLYWFQPWKLLTDAEVSERLTTVATPANSAAPTGSAAPASPDATAATLVSSGDFVSHEHDTSGSARIVRTADGRHRLELVGLNTSNGPDLRVWLTDQPVIEGRDGWHVFDDGRWVELGRLKGNRGDQGYAIPDDVKLTDLTSVSIWCKRFAVSFGAATLG
ncbi:DM13 domain-containing protein [Verrucosispora sp. WMMA2044]|uniref:DM13 domain-containing protein n=1 Tax=Verrucosispora sioxanthis TaxID=2499994 RepID=A0A6M1L448_9ACTN|nr:MULTISPECIES: DM13 domain-containing protein [Micromonospora]NEE64771.1 DM13 domain-containing protein [Verrucosispora sioxanthis]NGM13881.1 DM13 domain-containing protein [Verrucosispora sioxanthis]WBB49206.1 DM13 domain-containing protein [Verrucosispora sp. WMMA2044]